jgi:hypothetical protein
MYLHDVHQEDSSTHAHPHDHTACPSDGNAFAEHLWMIMFSCAGHGGLTDPTHSLFCAAIRRGVLARLVPPNRLHWVLSDQNFEQLLLGRCIVRVIVGVPSHSCEI